MIFRAIFWVGLVSLLTPHEPDLGLGRPGAGISLPAALSKSWGVSGLSRPACDGEACAGGLGPLDQWRTSAGQGLADIRAAIAAASSEPENSLPSVLNQRNRDFGFLGGAGAALHMRRRAGA